MTISEFLVSNGIPFQENVLLSEKSWIKTGGLCAYWVTPVDIGQLKCACRFLYQKDAQFDVVGHTSNIFFHSAYNPKVVVSTIKLNHFEVDNDIVNCECGVSVIKLAKFLLSEGYSGFYGLVGLPGTVASSIYNNAGCFSCSLSSLLYSIDVLTPRGDIQTFKPEDLSFTHRSSAFKRGDLIGVILSVKLKIVKAECREEELKKSDATKKYRKENQEGPYRNLGSIFSVLKPRHNIRNRLASKLAKVVEFAKLSDRRIAYKRLLLILYNYVDLDKYVSNKQLNTFVWLDKDAEHKFERYKEFMGKVYKDLTLEIEEKR